MVLSALSRKQELKTIYPPHPLNLPQKNKIFGEPLYLSFLKKREWLERGKAPLKLSLVNNLSLDG
tara:strand:- start:2148 stop:2342 length:195 start_codon:yes stop_codon:yes gene_type:complete